MTSQHTVYMYVQPQNYTSCYQEDTIHRKHFPEEKPVHVRLVSLGIVMKQM